MVLLLAMGAVALGVEPNASYRDWLLELGAVPADRIPDRARKPSSRAIVSGWVNPGYAGWDSYVPKDVQREFGIPKPPLTFARYVSFLRVEEYTAHRSADLYTVMVFTLEELLRRRIPITATREILQVYEAGIGLKEEAAQLLARAALPPREALALFEKHADVRLIPVLKIPADDEPYVTAVRAWSEKDGFDLYGRFLLKQLLADALPARFQADLRDFVLAKVALVKESNSPSRPAWWERLKMYEALPPVGDQRCWEAINTALLQDPVTETREQILVCLRKSPDSPRHVMDSVLKMIVGGGAKHGPVTPSRGAYDYEGSVRTYLKWAASAPNLNEATREKIRKATDELQHKKDPR